MLPRKSQKLEFLAERFSFFGLAASFDTKKLVKSQQKLLAASLKIPQLRSMTIASDRRKYYGLNIIKTAVLRWSIIMGEVCAGFYFRGS